MLQYEPSEEFVQWRHKLEVEKNELINEIKKLQTNAKANIEQELHKKRARLDNINAFLDEVIINQKLRG